MALALLAKHQMGGATAWSVLRYLKEVILMESLLSFTFSPLILEAVHP